MARLVAAFASSHSPMLTADVHDWEVNFAARDATRAHVDLDGRPTTFAELLASAPADARARIAPAELARRHAATRVALARLREDIARAELDALIVIGDDQEELFDHTNMPAIAIWHGPTIPNAARPSLAAPDWQDRARAHYLEDGQDVAHACDPALALHLLAALGMAGFDLSAARSAPAGKYEGHAFSFVHRVLGTTVPMVPLFLNAYYPPNQPSPVRCFALGAALRDAVASYRADARIGVFASGGLSHFVVDEAHDRAIVTAFQNRDHAMLRGIGLQKLQSGSSEIRNWICLAGTLGDLRLDWIEYQPGYRSPALTGTGLCFAHWR
jgi:3-O-methylgallate 3,4-dioxygenase